MIGAMLGALLINVLEQSLIRWFAISEFWRDFLLGFLILLAVASDQLIMNRLRSTWERPAIKETGARSDSTHPAPPKGGEHVA